MVSAITHEAVRYIRDLAASRYPRLKLHGIYSPQGREISKGIEAELSRTLHMAALQITEQIKRLRRGSYLLTYSSEAEAIGQATGKSTKYTLGKDRIQMVQARPSFSGGSIDDRVQMVMNRLLRKVMNVIELSAINEDEIDVMAERLERALPKVKAVPTEQRNLSLGKKLQEADRDRGPDMSFGLIDDETWEEWVDDYKAEYVPSWRGPENAYDVRTPSGADTRTEIYAWEMEQEITQDFVYQVRQGQIEAAKENGIQDYVWIAIVDNRTDDCCLWRDGLTTKEIEKILKTERSDDDCQAIVPPAHFNCRCVLAPMVEEMPERPESNIKDFEDWLNS
jgi:SPP1 gp7 family putative phage head morphogenesis protein